MPSGHPEGQTCASATGWFSLNHATTGEGEDAAVVEATIARLAPLLDDVAAPCASAELKWLNGELYLLLSSLVNRRRFEADAISHMLDLIAQHVLRPGPGQW